MAKRTLKNYLSNMSEISDRELLFRVDERLKLMSKKLDDMCRVINKKVDRDDDYKEMVDRVNKMWDKWNLAIGYMMGAGIVGGVSSKLLTGFVTSVMAAFK